MIELAEQHRLTYDGRVDPAPGTLMGPGIDGRVWKVVGAMFDPTTGKTSVTVEAAY